MKFNFELTGQCLQSSARAGVLTTAHGLVETPVFMPVGTQATVRSQTATSLREAGSKILLANTYHLFLRPGLEVLEHFNGIHRFMKWDGPILTDSGGYQVFSLSKSCVLSEEGAQFKSAVDGRVFLLSPEISIRAQESIGSDIMMAFDQCIPSIASQELALSACQLTHRWALRSLQARSPAGGALFGIVQGACYPELRELSARQMTELPFDGYAIGGLAVGESRSQRQDITELTTRLLPKNSPRYLMGVGTPQDLLDAIYRGVDLFDCILPTAFAQQGAAFTSRGKLDLRRTVYRLQETALDPECQCSTCTTYSRAYLHHLIKAHEVLGWHLIGHHNLFFYHQLLQEARRAILDQRYVKFYSEKREVLAQGDQEFPSMQGPTKRRPRDQKSLGDFEIHTNPTGSSSIKDLASGEVMHSVNDPNVEAQSVYVDQLSERTQPWVLWDVGLGAAHNAMAAIHLAIKNRHPLKIISFDTTLDPLKLACKFPDRFPHIRHAAAASLLKHGHWRDKQLEIEWSFQLGPFLETLQPAPLPDAIFYDLFSSKSNPIHWTLAAFNTLFAKIKEVPVEFVTYSNSTAVRAALLAAGFYVGAGNPSGPKESTTLAYTPLALPLVRRPLFGPEWLAHWERSGARYPLQLPESDQPSFAEKIRRHPQLSGHFKNPVIHRLLEPSANQD